MNDPRESTEAVENYLKVIYQLSQAAESAGPQEIAQTLNVSGSGVSKMLRHLEKLNCVEYSPYRGVRLTDRGRAIALEVIRHHRLIELYLTEHLGYGWDEVHDEAERLEHHISEEFENRIERALGSPAFDPHGDPIPTRDGQVPAYSLVTLDSQPEGARMVVSRVTDENGALLRYLGERNIRPGAAVRLLERQPFGGLLRLDVNALEEMITPEAARHVFVDGVSEAVTPPEVPPASRAVQRRPAKPRRSVGTA